MTTQWQHATNKSAESWDQELDRMANRDAVLVNELIRRGEYVKPTQQGIDVAQQLFEENVNATRQYRWKNQAELVHWSSRFVNFLTEAEFLRKLNKVGEVAGFRGVYNDWSVKGMRGLSFINRDGSKKKYVCAIQAGCMPEYSIMRFDEHFLPQNEMYRGWRTVLLRTLDAGLATEQQLHEVFGEPTLGVGSRRYREELWNIRNFCTKQNPWAN